MWNVWTSTVRQVDKSLPINNKITINFVHKIHSHFNSLFVTWEKPAVCAIVPDVVTKLSKLLDPAHVTPRVKLCIHTKF